jgi:predicted RNA-binding Zn ribbon-like protein
VELAYYSDYAVRLVNSEEPQRGTDALTSVEAVREMFGASTHAASRAVEAADEGDEVRAVDLLNALMLEFPVSPQISGHDHLDDATGRPDWHMHLADHAATASAGYSATACMGLAFQLTTLGADRLGICEASPCRNAYVDTSTNRSRRYCSDRCATRANVAAYRARKRLESERSARSGLTQDAAQDAHEAAPATER